MARIKGTEFRNQRDLTGELEYEFIAQAIQWWMTSSVWWWSTVLRKFYGTWYLNDVRKAKDELLSRGWSQEHAKVMIWSRRFDVVEQELREHIGAWRMRPEGRWCGTW
jgi:hypothetical protein